MAAATPAQPEPLCRRLANQRLGNVQLFNRLGSGTYGAVYETASFTSGPDEAYRCVVKVFDDHANFNDEFAKHERVCRKVMDQLDQEDDAFPFPRLPPGIHAGSSTTSFGQRVYFLRMERAMCKSANFHLEHNETVLGKMMSVKTVVPMVVEAIRVCSLLARAGLAHGDINLGNILFHDDHRHSVMLCDFGFLTYFGAERELGTYWTRSSNYVRNEKRKRGPVTMFTDVEAVLYIGLVMLGVKYQTLLNKKADVIALKKAIREELKELRKDFVENESVKDAYIKFLSYVWKNDRNISSYTYDPKIADEIAGLNLALAQAVGFKTIEELRVPLPFYDTPKATSTVGAAGCPKCGLMKRC